MLARDQRVLSIIKTNVLDPSCLITVCCLKCVRLAYRSLFLTGYPLGKCPRLPFTQYIRPASPWAPCLMKLEKKRLVGNEKEIPTCALKSRKIWSWLSKGDHATCNITDSEGNPVAGGTFGSNDGRIEKPVFAGIRCYIMRALVKFNKKDQQS